MKIQCLVCRIEPVVEVPTPEHEGQLIECPDCGFYLLECRRKHPGTKSKELEWFTRLEYFLDAMGRVNKKCPTVKWFK